MDKIDIKICKAACCGYVPIEKHIMQKHRDKLHKDAKKIINTDKIEIWVVGDTCGFLNKRYRCKIYNDRPEICKLMGSNHVEHDLLKCSYLRNYTMYN
jgi:Fe-S-cluster containining protein